MSFYSLPSSEQMKRIVRVQFEERDDRDTVLFYGLDSSGEEYPILWFETNSPTLTINGREVILQVILPILEKVTEKEFYEIGTYGSADWIRKDRLNAFDKEQP